MALDSYAALKTSVADWLLSRAMAAAAKVQAWAQSMSSAMQGGNEKMLKISKAFGAAQALISAWQGAAEALKLASGMGSAMAGRLLMLDGRRMEWTDIRLPRQPSCPVCAQRHPVC